MKQFRSASPQPESWDVEEVQNNLGCSRDKAKEVMNEYRKANDISGYDFVEKEPFLAWLEKERRAERERDARHQSDLATIKSVTILQEQVSALKEQVATLKEMGKASSNDARRAHTQSQIANVLAVVAIVVSIIAIILKVV